MSTSPGPEPSLKPLNTVLIKKPPKPTWVLNAADFAAGVVAGMVGLVVGYPIDTIKTRMQIGAEKSVLGALRHSIRTEGVLSLFRGLASPIFGYAFMSGLSYGGYGTALRTLKSRDILTSHPNLQSLLAGACSGAFYSLASSPVDRVKIVMQSSPRDKYKNSWACAKDITKQFGFRYLYFGFRTNLPSEILGWSLWFGFYSYFKTNIPKWNGVETPTFGMLYLAGSMSGSLMWLIVFPVDVIRSRLFQELNPTQPKYKGGFDAIRQLYKSQGLSWCYKGFSATLMRTIPVSGIILSLNETFGTFLKEEL